MFEETRQYLKQMGMPSEAMRLICLPPRCGSREGAFRIEVPTVSGSLQRCKHKVRPFTFSSLPSTAAYGCQSGCRG